MGHFVQEEEDKAKVQKELSILTDRLQKAGLVSASRRGLLWASGKIRWQVNESLVRKTQARNEYDKTIQETEAGFTSRPNLIKGWLDSCPRHPLCTSHRSAVLRTDAALSSSS